MNAHRDHKEDFRNLTYAEQAKSISAQIANLSKSIRAHIRQAKLEGRNMDTVRQKCVGQVQRLLDRL